MLNIKRQIFVLSHLSTIILRTQLLKHAHSAWFSDMFSLFTIFFFTSFTFSRSAMAFCCFLPSYSYLLSSCLAWSWANCIFKVATSLSNLALMSSRLPYFLLVLVFRASNLLSLFSCAFYSFISYSSMVIVGEFSKN